MRDGGVYRADSAPPGHISGLMTNLGRGAAAEAAANDATAALGPALRALIDERAHTTRQTTPAPPRTRRAAPAPCPPDGAMDGCIGGPAAAEGVRGARGQSEDERGWGDSRRALRPRGGTEGVFRFWWEPARSRTLLNCAVTRVDWSGEGRRRHRGATRGIPRVCSRRILPLGVLQRSCRVDAGAVEGETDALRRLRMGHYKKVLLRWRDAVEADRRRPVPCVHRELRRSRFTGLQSEFTVFYNLHWQLGPDAR